MKKFVVERSLPGVGNLTETELQITSQSFLDTTSRLLKPCLWVESFITNDKMYCIYLAENEQQVREHSRLGKFHVNRISEVKAIIDPVTETCM